jgi:hypothetical protein
MEVINHTNRELFDVYVCEKCTDSYIYTRYRHVCYNGSHTVLATTIRIDEYYVILNYCFHLSSQRDNYTQIHIGITQIFDLNYILRLPLHDPAQAKRKLQIYTTFS